MSRQLLKAKIASARFLQWLSSSVFLPCGSQARHRATLVFSCGNAVFLSLSVQLVTGSKVIFQVMTVGLGFIRKTSLESVANHSISGNVGAECLPFSRALSETIFAGDQGPVARDSLGYCSLGIRKGTHTFFWTFSFNFAWHLLPHDYGARW